MKEKYLASISPRHAIHAHVQICPRPFRVRGCACDACNLCRALISISRTLLPRPVAAAARVRAREGCKVGQLLPWRRAWRQRLSTLKATGSARSTNALARRCDAVRGCTMFGVRL